MPRRFTAKNYFIGRERTEIGEAAYQRWRNATREPGMLAKPSGGFNRLPRSIASAAPD